MRNALLLAGLVLSCVAFAGVHPAGAASPFDGNWAVTIVCSTTADGALAFSYQFNATVNNGILHGEHGLRGSPGSLALDGPIGPDGHALFSAEGLTGAPAYNVGHVPELNKVRYHSNARFEGARGTGTRVETRPCDAAFQKY